jgi:hypothetical protein
MKKFICDCCKREIRSTEMKSSVEIKRGNDTEYRLDDICEDCFDRFRSIIENAEKWRLNNK